jgi:hypothetical protein
MNLFFYMPKPGGRKGELLSAVVPLASRGSLEVFPNLKSFAARMRRPKEALSIVLIWNPSREDLRKIGSMKDFLRGARIVLVLSDQETETIKLAHRVFPAYIAYVDDAIPEIVSVLKRLTRPCKTSSGTEAGCR